MQKNRKAYLITLAILISSYVIVRITNTVQVYKCPITSNEPTIQYATRIVATNLKKPENLDFICFYHNDNLSGNHIRTFRLCGRPDDMIEIRTGDLYINGQMADANLHLSHSYQMNVATLQTVMAKMQIDEETIYHKDKDTVIVSLSDDFVAQNNIPSVRDIKPATYKNESIAQKFSANWNEDNFDPIKVPIGKFFVLGDNRNAAEDSRYIGFVDESAFVGTVLWK